MLNGGRIENRWQPMSQLTCIGPVSFCSSFIALKIGRSGQPVQNVGGPVWAGTRYWVDAVWLSPDPVFIPNRATLLGATVKPEELLTLPARAIVRRLYHEEDIRLFANEPVSFRCSCSRERVGRFLHSVSGVSFMVKLLRARVWMPWRKQAMKDVVSCDKPRGAANRL